eukprot:2318619-Rhodomonas_salina.2
MPDLSSSCASYTVTECPRCCSSSAAPDASGPCFAEHAERSLPAVSPPAPAPTIPMLRPTGVGDRCLVMQLEETAAEEQQHQTERIPQERKENREETRNKGVEQGRTNVRSDGARLSAMGLKSMLLLSNHFSIQLSLRVAGAELKDCHGQVRQIE